MLKKCTRCGVEKDATKNNFRVRVGAPDGFRATCKECLKQSDAVYKTKNRYQIRAYRMRSYYNNREREIERAKALSKQHPEWGRLAADNYKKKRPYYNSIRQRKRNARLVSMPFDDPKEIETYLMSLPQECNYCGIALKEYLANEKNYRNDMTFQIDKIDPKRGYVIGNITLACAICNYVKGNWFDEETMKEIGQIYVKKYWES